MAQRNYLVEGLSGTGKSSVYEELIARGYKAISTDRAWKLRVGHISLWDPGRALEELESPEPEVLFVCGSSSNRDRFLPYFTKVFNLRVDDETMRRRLEERTNNDFGKQPDELELMLRLNRGGERPDGAIDVDAMQPLDQVVDEVLRLADCTTAASDSTTPTWSKRGSVTGRSFVIPQSELPVVQAADELRAVLRGKASTCLEYAWSGHLLTTLLPYLGEQGIDLMHSPHDEVASAISEARQVSASVLTSDQRERFVARLDPSVFDGAALRRHYEEVSETTAEGVGYAMLDGIAFLRDTLEVLDPHAVAVLIVG